MAGNSNDTAQAMQDFVNHTMDTVQVVFESTWDQLTGPSSPLNDLHHQMHDSINSLYSKLTNGGTLPVLSDWVEIPAQAWAPAPPPPPPPSPGVLRRLGDNASRHPYLFAFLTTSVVGGTTYYFYPNTVKAHAQAFAPLLRPLKAYVPLRLLPDPKRPSRLISEHGEFRKEAVLVLGADGIARELAMDLESKGFIVIATVRNPADVDALEKRSRGWMKVLVLNPTESSSVAPFMRSLGTALSLRFPLHTSGDPFSRPSHAVALTAVINCLALPVPIAASFSKYCPVEGLDTEDVVIQVGERLATVAGVLKGVMPILRTMSGRPGAAEGVFVSLVPAATANVSLPFDSLASAADAALLAMLNALRREMTASRVSSNVRVTILETGLFEMPTPITSQTSYNSATSSGGSSSLPPPYPGGSVYGRVPEQMSQRLGSIYAPALARRNRLHSADAISNGADGREGHTRRKGSAVRKLSKQVYNCIVYSRGGSRSRVGAGALTYHFLSYLPQYFVDVWLSLQDRLVAIVLRNQLSLTGRGAGRSRIGSNSNGGGSQNTNSASTASGRPLPTPPIPSGSSSHHQHPASLRPGQGQAAANTSSGSHGHQGNNPSTSGPYSYNRSRNGDMDESGSSHSDEGKSSSTPSTEEFGFGSGLGSFVGSEAGWKDGEDPER